MKLPKQYGIGRNTAPLFLTDSPTPYAAKIKAKTAAYEAKQKRKTELTYPEFVGMFEGEDEAENRHDTYTKDDMEEAYRAGENKQTYYFKDTTVILPNNYQAVDG